MLKRVYMVQPSSLHTTEMPLPYSIAVLEAYARENELIDKNYFFEEYIFEKKEIDDVLHEISNPFMVAFSCYVWNFEYNKSLAKAIKERYPRAIIVFGGHSVTINSSEILQEHKFIDYAIMGEGELPFSDLLLFLLGKKEKSELINIAYRTTDGTCNFIFNENYVPNVFPSPYEKGLFDNIIKKYSHKYHFTATLETNRGCPFSCAYCDWGLNNVKIRFIDETRIWSDMEWIGKNNIYTCYCADSNFGMFDRDNIFIDKLIEYNRKNNSPKSFFVSYSKNSDERVLQIVKKLKEQKMLHGATLSFQSLNPETLVAIGRKNMNLDYFSNLMRKYNELHLPTYSELILGLPNETLDSFIGGIGLLISCGQHRSIKVYNCELLSNSYLGQKSTIEKYNIKTVKIPFRRYDNIGKDTITEYSNTVVSTNTLSKSDWCTAHLFSNLVRVYHCSALLHCIAIYTYNAHNIPYDQFYLRLLRFLKNHPCFNELFEKINAQLFMIADGKSNWFINYNGKEMSFEHAIYIHTLKNVKEFYAGIRDFLSETLTERDLCEELIEFQKYISDIKMESSEDRSKEFLYDFDKYFNDVFLGKSATLHQKLTQIKSSEITSSYYF